jgi:hypothetical protein
VQRIDNIEINLHGGKRDSYTSDEDEKSLKKALAEDTNFRNQETDVIKEIE